jgi:hypothetical protein
MKLSLKVPAATTVALVIMIIMGSTPSLPAGTRVIPTGSGGGGANFVYTHDDVFGGANTVSAFSVDDNGNLARIKHSPFVTGGRGSGEGYFGAKRIVTRTERCRTSSALRASD